ncbi:hypothetical protein ABW19_dt0210593 [Dactylella cylindrospora]|nr:hypothetical protein ABW19_dt0210593 [Dactylella cylindrospora]
MFKQLGGLFGGKSSSSDSQAQAPQPEQRPQFQVLTLGDLPKLSAATVAPAQPAVVTAISNQESRRLALSDGPRRSVPEDTHLQDIPDDLKSCAASIVTNGISPLTPGSGNKPSKFDQIWRSRSKRLRGDDDVSPVSALEPLDENSATNRFRINEDDYEDDPFADTRSRYTASSVYDDRNSSNDPFADGSRRARSFRSRAGANMPPRLDTNFLVPHTYSPSLRSEASRRSNPFGDTPQQENNPAVFPRMVSPISAIEPASQDIRYSDCGVNPFQGLDDAARRERESSGTVSDIWNLIVGRSKESKKTMPSPRIEIDTSALDQPSVAGPSRSRSLMNARPPDSAGSVSPAEWFSNILVDYEGRPPEISRAMSYVPTPISPHPPGLSPQKITTIAVPYLANLEIELEELRKYKADKESQERAQEERDRVRDLIQRQLENEQAIEALQKAIGGKRMTRQQLESPNIWTEIDLSGAKRDPVSDRRSMETVWPGTLEENAPPVPKIPSSHQPSSSANSRVTVWPSFEQNIPPVPKIPDQTKLAKPKSPKPFKGFFGWGAKREESEPSQAPVKEVKETPIVLNTSRKAAKVLSVTSANFLNTVPERSQPQRSTGSYEERYAPSKEDEAEVSDAEEPMDEKRPQGHARSNTVDTITLGSPPPYTRGATANPYHSRSNSRPETGISEAYIPRSQVKRHQLKPSDLPKLSTGSTNGTESQAPRQLTRAVGLTQMQFTPTTPHHARSAQIYGNQRRVAPNHQINLNELGFRSRAPGDLRDKAERRRRRQEKRERCFRRGGWLWMCGLCCGVSKMTRKCKIFWWTFFIVIIIASTVVGAVTGVKNSNTKPAPVEENKPEMVTLPNLPPMPVGEVTVTPRLLNTVNTCISPSTMWSCKLPPPLLAGLNNQQPIFNWRIVALNGTNDVFVNPSPPWPVVEQYRNMSKLDGVLSSPSEGEQTGFYVTLLASNTTTSSDFILPEKLKRSHPRQFTRSANPSPQDTETQQIQQIPPSAVLPTAYSSQQLRLFDGGLPSEHYKFMTFFDKTIYLRSIDADKDSSGSNKLDTDGGVSPSEARWVCKFPNTRYTTKIFTRPAESDDSGKKKFIVNPTTIAVDRGSNPGGLAGYAVQIEEDIANYDRVRATISCWQVDERGKIVDNSTQKRIVTEGFNTGKSGVDYRGCQCSWSNFKESSTEL